MKNRKIQYFRFALFFLILLFHCNVPFSNILWIGIEAFFVISAYFLTQKYLNAQFSFIQAFKHRLLRLYPPYLIVIALGVIYSCILRSFPYDVFFHLGFIQNPLWMFTGYMSPMQPVTAHTWTLSIEILCDILLLLLLRFAKKHFKFIVCLLAFSAILFRTICIIFRLNQYVISLCPISHLDAFAFGALLSILNSKGSIRLWHSVVLIALGLLGIISCIVTTSLIENVTILEGYKLYSDSSHYLDNWFTGNIYLFVTLLSVGLVALFLRFPSHNETGSNLFVAFLTFLGDNSYSMYLFHWPILFALKKINSAWFVTFPVTLVLTIFISFVFYKIFSYVYSLIIKKREKTNA